MSVTPPEPRDLFSLALQAFGQGDIAQAVTYTHQAAAAEPDNAVFVEAVTYLRRVEQVGKQHVYVAPDAFTAFIRGGGNIPLYEATSAALGAVYRDYATLTLLDIGVGDGHALLPALTPNIRQLDVLEPSPALLEEVHLRLTERNVPHTAMGSTLQAFAQHATGVWDVIQATYSLQSIPPTERLPLLGWLRSHGQRLLIAEFDVPNFPAMYAPEHVQYMLDHYARGLAEYDANRDLVAQGFLMPVLFGAFDPTVARTNYEQPIQMWQDELHTAGFRNVAAQPLYEYWWAMAYLIDAS